MIGCQRSQHLKLSKFDFCACTVFGALSIFAELEFAIIKSAELSGTCHGNCPCSSGAEMGRKEHAAARPPRAPAPSSAHKNRERGASPQAASDAGEGDAAERQEDNPLEDDPRVTSKKMSWRMLLASKDGMTAAAGITAQSHDANSIHEDSAEYQYLKQERDEQATVEKASADAQNMEDCLWCSDTTSAALEQSLRARVKQVADGSQVHTFMKGWGGIARACRCACPVLAHSHARVHP